MAEYAHPQEAPVEPVVSSPLSRRFGTKWRLGLALAAAGVLLLIYGLAAPLIGGIGLWGTDIPHVWGFGIANYAWWIGIANGASLLASILVLRRHNLRTAINRFAEAVAVAAVFAAGLYPIIHLGRPLLAYWMFPYPATTGLWPQFLSPLTWDFWAILAHVFVTTLFWYVGLIPDLALLRDRAKRKWAQNFYGVLALGWRGSVAHWALHQRTHRLVAIAVIPMLFVMQSAVAFMFASTIVPGWHSTRLPLQLVVTGFESGLAAMLLVAWLLRRGLSLERHIDDLDMDLLGRLLAANALVAAWLFAGMLYFGLSGRAGRTRRAAAAAGRRLRRAVLDRPGPHRRGSAGALVAAGAAPVRPGGRHCRPGAGRDLAGAAVARHRRHKRGADRAAAGELLAHRSGMGATPRHRGPRGGTAAALRAHAAGCVALRDPSR